MPAASLWILRAISNKSSPWKVSQSNPLRQSPVKLNYGWGSGLIWLLIWSAAPARILILPIPIIVTLPISFWHWFMKTKNHYVKIYWLHPLSRPQTRSLSLIGRRPRAMNLSFKAELWGVCAKPHMRVGFNRCKIWSNRWRYGRSMGLCLIPKILNRWLPSSRVVKSD